MMRLHPGECRKQPVSLRRSRRGSWQAALSLMLLAGMAPAVHADIAANKSDAFLKRIAAVRPTSGWSAVIVRLDGALTPDHARQLKRLGCAVYRHLHSIHSIALRVPSRQLSRLAALPWVRHLSTDFSVHKCDAFTVGASGASIAWQAPYNLNGSGVGVAIVDSGVHFCNDLATTVKGGPARIIAKAQFGQTNTDDFCGHGTHVAGIIAGNGAASTGNQYFHTFYGIAPEANLINACVLNYQGQGNVSDVIAAIQSIVTNRVKYNVRVLNLSLGHPVGESYTTDPLCQAVEQAWQAGIVVVCAAGNDGRLNTVRDPDSSDNEGWGTAYGSIQSPGNDPYVITVGAMKNYDGQHPDDRIATYSSRGPSRLDFVLKPDIVAPGNQIISLDTNNSYLFNNFQASNGVPLSYYCTHNTTNDSKAYFCLSGTSMAAPVVSGAAALMLQAQPNLTPDTVKARLMLSADKWAFPDGSADPCTFGAGYIDIPAALNCTAVATQYALSPTLSQDGNGNVSIDMHHLIWGSHTLWGTGITDLRAIWGNRALWGSSANILDASHAIWGQSVWNDHAIWGSDTTAVDLSSVAINGE